MNINGQDNPEVKKIGVLANFLFMMRQELYKNFIAIVIVMLSGVILGFSYWYTSPHKFESKITFVVEEGKASLGGLASIAGQFGFDLPGAGVGGLLAGENVILFLKSEQLCREVLETPYFGDSSLTLARKYAETHQWDKVWEKKFPNLKLSFRPKAGFESNRVEDSLMHIIVSSILKNDLSIAKPDKKATFVEVNVQMYDENLAILFSQRLVNLTINKYVESRTLVKQVNVQKLQKRADSLLAILNQRTYTSGLMQQPIVDVNPGMKLQQIPVEISVRDKTIISAIYIEVAKNLELAKVSLSQEAPVIQIVDKDWPPLADKKVKLLISIFFGLAITIVIYFFYRILIYFLKNNDFIVK